MSTSRAMPPILFKGAYVCIIIQFWIDIGTPEWVFSACVGDISLSCRDFCSLQSPFGMLGILLLIWGVSSFILNAWTKLIFDSIIILSSTVGSYLRTLDQFLLFVLTLVPSLPLLAEVVKVTYPGKSDQIVYRQQKCFAYRQKGQYITQVAALLRSFNFALFIMCRLKLSGYPGLSMLILIRWVESLILVNGENLQVFSHTFRLFSVLSQSIGLFSQIQPSVQGFVPNFGVLVRKVWTLSVLIDRI